MRVQRCAFRRRPGVGMFVQGRQRRFVGGFACAGAAAFGALRMPRVNSCGLVRLVRVGFVVVLMLV
jgi:hypothetical protein